MLIIKINRLTSNYKRVFFQVLAYMAAYTSITLNFIQENYSLLFMGETSEGERYTACKSLWWDYVTETGELVILIFGIHLSYASRNARTQFHVSIKMLKGKRNEGVLINFPVDDECLQGESRQLAFITLMLINFILKAKALSQCHYF